MTRGRAPDGTPCCCLEDGHDQVGATTMRCSDNDIVSKGTCIAAKVSGNKKPRTGVDDTGYGKDAKHGNDSRRENITTRGTH